MRTTRCLALAFVFGVSASAVAAQEPPQGASPGGQGGPGGVRRPASPLVAALDANHDGVIGATEIANAPAALRTLDKNGDGQLTRDEFRPQPPAGESRPGGSGGPGGSKR